MHSTEQLQRAITTGRATVRVQVAVENRGLSLLGFLITEDKRRQAFKQLLRFSGLCCVNNCN